MLFALLYLGVTRKATGAVLKIVHIRPPPESLLEFREAIERNKELDGLLSKFKQELLNPIIVYDLFQQIPQEVNGNVQKNK